MATGAVGIVATMGQDGRVASGVPNVSMSASEAAFALKPGNKVKCHCGPIRKGARGTPMCWESSGGDQQPSGVKATGPILR